MSSKPNKIKRLSDREHVRMRPGMYLTSVSNSDILLREIIDNSIDEIFAYEKCDKIEIKYLNEYHLVSDNGRGIPITWDPEEEMTSVELAKSSLKAGNKFDKQEIQTGMNGVGSSCVNFVSEEYIVLSKITESNFNDSIPEVKTRYESEKSSGIQLYYYLKFEKGIKAEEGVKTISEINEMYGLEWTPEFVPSTVVFFKADLSIIESRIARLPHYNLSMTELILKRFYNKDVHYFTDRDIIPQVQLYSNEIFTEIDLRDTSEFNDKARFLISFEVTKDFPRSHGAGSVNSLSVNRGIHINYFLEAYRNSLMNIYNLGSELKSYLTMGLNYSIIVLANEVLLVPQTKDKLDKIDGFTNKHVSELTNIISSYIKKNKSQFDDHIQRVREYASSMIKLKNMDFIKSKVKLGGGAGTRADAFLPTNKLSDCHSRNRDQCTLFICEGDSAGGSITKARDNEFQAIYKLRGRPLNASKSSLERVLENDELNALINCIGYGIKGYESKTPRYGRIVLVCDADADGYMISSSIIGMFAKFIPHMITNGQVFVAITPLYIQGGKYIYFDNEDELDRTKPFERNKGIGSLNIEDVEATITNDATARLFQITDENMDQCLEILTQTSAKYKLMQEIGVL